MKILQRESFSDEQTKRRRPDQIVKLLQKRQAMLAAGKSAAEVFQKLDVSESTWQRWNRQYGGMKSDEAKRPWRELQQSISGHGT